MRTPEKDLKNIRIILKSKIPEFAKSIAMSEEELIKIENGERKLSNTELYVICSLLLNIMDSIVSPRNDSKEKITEEDKIRIENNRFFILNILADYIANYNPANKDKIDTKKKVLAK